MRRRSSKSSMKRRGLASRVTAGHYIYLLVYSLVFALGVICVQTGNTVMIGVGSSLVAAGIAGWVLFILVFIDQDERQKRKLVTDLGLVDAFESRSSQIKSEYDRRIDGARTSIDIMGFGLRALLDDYRDAFAGWAGKAHVRILLLDPDYPAVGRSYAAQRDIEEGNDEGRIARDVRTFLEQTRELRAQHPQTFRVRLYTSLPSINIFRVDDELFWGPYLVKSQSRNSPTFVVRKGGMLYDKLVDQFEGIWSNDALSHEAPTDLPNESGLSSEP